MRRVEREIMSDRDQWHITTSFHPKDRVIMVREVLP